MPKIPLSSDIKKEINSIKKKLDTELKKELEVLRQDIIDKTPIDTGKLQKSISRFKRIESGHYRILSPLHYSYQILVLGRTGPGMGSLQLPNGIYPEIRKWVRTLEVK